MAEDKITDTYLPPEHWGAVEDRILKCAPSLAGPICDPQDVETITSLRLCASPIDSCIRNLTHRFTDGPTWFVITEADAANAMIARFPSYQCIVVSQAFHIYASLLLAQLLSWPALRLYLQTGAEVPDPGTEPARDRIEALQNLLHADPDIEPEVRQLTASLIFLLLYLLTAHEIGHLALGHLDQSAASQMVEAGAETEGKAESRALEWDADGFALVATLWLTGSAFREQPVWSDLLPDTPAGLRVVGVVAYVMFTVMDMLADQDRPPETRTHPRPLVRMGLAMYTLARVMHAGGAADGSVVIDAMAATSRSIEITLHQLAGGAMEPDLAHALGEELSAEIERLEPVYHQLIPTLDRSRLSGLFWARPLDAGYLPAKD